MAPMAPKAAVRPSSSRPKPQLSCGTCRARKLKCDRRQPCSNCAKTPRNDCVYSHNHVAGVVQHHTRKSKSRSHEDRVSCLENRLQEVVAVLEGFTANTSQNAPADQEASFHHVDNPSHEHSIVSSSWEGLLRQITDMQREISSIRYSSSEASITSTTNKNATSPHLLITRHTDINTEELRCVMVTQQVAEALFDIVAADAYTRWIFILVHRPTFRKEVAAYWQSPMSVDLAWLSTFYSVLAIASHLASRSPVVIDHLPFPERISQLCLIRSAQCLRDSDYINPSAHTVCAMILYLASEHNWTQTGHFGASIIIGITVGLAMRLGYHRDPSWFPNVTPFQGEMRRRSWIFLKQLDHLIAEKCGLPRFIDDRKTDTKLPLNLLDEDLHPEMLCLPPARSDDTPTAIAVLNHKDRIWAIHGRITDEIHNIQAMAYENVLELEQNLSAEVLQTPPWLRMNLTANSNAIAIDQRNAQIEVDLMVQSARMALHHRYVVPAYTNPKYTKSRQACLDAAQKTLVLQRSLFEMSDVYTDGLGMNWRFISLMAHDFLFAALLFCLDLYQGLRNNSQFAVPLQNGIAKAKERTEHLQLLRVTQGLWSTFGEHHSSGKEAAIVLDTLLKKFTFMSTSGFPISTALQHEPIEQKQSYMHHTLDPQDATAQKDDPIDTAPSWNVTYDPIAIGYSQPHEDYLPRSWNPDLPNRDFAQIQSMLNDSQIDFDWNAWNEGMCSGDMALGHVLDPTWLL